MSYTNIKERKVKEIIELIRDGGISAWKKGWATQGGLAKNPTTGKYYRGINQLLLGSAGFNNPYFLTLKQGNKLGGKVKSGSKGTTIIRGVEMERKEVDALDAPIGELPNRKFFVMVPWTVFNISQFEGLNLDVAMPDPTRHTKSPEVLDYMMQKMGPLAPKVRFEQKTPCYYPMSDTIVMPPVVDFYDVYEFMATYVHELGHATGHQSRLHRPHIYEARFGTKEYAKEEIFVELAASMVCAELGIETGVDHARNHSAYISHWLDAMNEDPSYLFKALAEAGNIFDYIIAFKEGYEPTVTSKIEEAPKPAPLPRRAP